VRATSVLEVPPFRPGRLARGGHRQTWLGYWRRRFLAFAPTSEDLIVETRDEHSGESVRLLCRASWQPGERDAAPALVLVHGLCGSDAASYMHATGRLAYARGWHVLRMNLRGAGASEALCARLYNAGLDEDVLAVLQAAGRHSPRVALAGFSLGANLALLAAGRRAAALPVGLRAVVGISPPLDLAACAQAIDAPVNRFYQYNFMLELRAAYRRRQRLRPDLFEAGRERGVHSVQAYDDRITAPHGGYRNAGHYYASSSAGPWLHGVRVPALVLAALDDPLVPGDSVRRFREQAATQVEFELLPTGGHMGFFARSQAPGHFWAADRLLAFAEAQCFDEGALSRRAPSSSG
jgi:hypothetical protein